MDLFTPRNSFPNKVNFVDGSNRFVGYDLEQNCCEYASYHIACSPGPGLPNLPEYSPEELRPYAFADEPPTHLDHETSDTYTVSFRLVAPGLPDLWLTLSNQHNGYYAHGFTSWIENGSI